MNVSSSKIGHDVSNKVVQNLTLEKNVLTKDGLLNWYSPMKKKIKKNSVDFWHQKLTLKVQFWHFLSNLHSSIDTLSMLILGRESCFLGPTKFEIPQPNWYYSTQPTLHVSNHFPFFVADPEINPKFEQMFGHGYGLN